MSAVVNGVLITGNLEMFNVQSTDGITWKVIPDECNSGSGMGDSGSLDHRSDNVSDRSATDQ